jgi:hypothetical protein
MQSTSEKSCVLNVPPTRFNVQRAYGAMNEPFSQTCRQSIAVWFECRSRGSIHAAVLSPIITVAYQLLIKSPSVWVSVPELILHQEHLQNVLRPPHLETHGAHKVGVKHAFEATGQHTYLRPTYTWNKKSVRINFCWSSPAQSFFLSSTAGFMTILYCLVTLGVVQLWEELIASLPMTWHGLHRKGKLGGVTQIHRLADSKFVS